MKRLDYTLFDEIEGKAKDSPRRRANYDLRTQAMDEDPAWCDTSQRMLNVLMKDSVVPVHRHTNSSETVVVLRGSGDEVFYDDLGKEVERITLRHGSDCAAAQVPRNVYHTFIPLEDGTVIFEAKDRAYDPETMEVLSVGSNGFPVR